MSENQVRQAMLQYLADVDAANKRLRDALQFPAPTRQPVTPPEQMPLENALGLLKWRDTSGPNGPFRISGKLDNVGNKVFDDVVAIIQNEEGHKKFLKGGNFVWLMSNGDAIGMKQVKPQ